MAIRANPLDLHYSLTHQARHQNGILPTHPIKLIAGHRHIELKGARQSNHWRGRHNVGRVVGKTTPNLAVIIRWFVAIAFATEFLAVQFVALNLRQAG